MTTQTIARATGSHAVTHPAQHRPDPRPLVGAPLVLDTDIGGDADDAVALTIAA